MTETQTRFMDVDKPLVDLPVDFLHFVLPQQGQVGWRCPDCGRGRVFKGNVQQEAAEAKGHACGDPSAVVTVWDNTDAGHAKARREHLDRVLPRHVTEVLRQLQRIGAVERAVDTLLNDGFPALNQAYLPHVSAEEWWEEDLTFTPSTPNVFVTVDEQEVIRQKLVYMRGMLGLRSDGLTQCLTQLLKGAEAAGVSVPTTLDPVTPA